MDLSRGYQQTEFGPIPDDWRVHSLGDLGEALIGLTYSPANVREYGTLVLRSSNIQGNKLSFDDNVFVDMSIPERILARPNDVLVCVRNGSRELIGKSVLLDSRVKGMSFGAFMAVYRSAFGPLASFLFQSSILKRQIHEHLGATINQITNKSLVSFRVPFPPRDEERTAIVTALTDVEALIDGLACLIVKKRDIKQAAMQQLLTGRTRLMSFQGAWEECALGEVAAIRNSKVIASRADAGTLCVDLDSLESASGRLLQPSLAGGNSPKYAFKKGDVLFGRLRAYLRKYWQATFDGLCSTEIWPLMPRDQRLDPRYLRAIVQTDAMVDAASIAYGTHMPRADWSVVKQLPVLLPPVDEQGAIADVLGDMDAEIDALEARLEKTRALKQAMMQELLSGRTRLV